jgi:hypothetical protein
MGLARSVETLNVALDPIAVAEATAGGTVMPCCTFGLDPIALALITALRTVARSR